MTVEQHFADSEDGTKVPYFLVLPKGYEAGSDTPTLIFGYGGFQISLPPSYSATVGHAWLERGGAYVVANLRGRRGVRAALASRSAERKPPARL